jgi:putative N6-adenine-specific DNA methylase
MVLSWRADVRNCSKIHGVAGPRECAKVRDRRSARPRLARAAAASHASIVSDHEIFAITAPGLEHVCAAELRALGIAPALDAVAGGVHWRGGVRSVYRANLESRTASRVVVRAGSFRARTFAELERHASKLDWSRLLRPAAPVTLRVTCRKSKLYHEGAVAERLQNVLAATVGANVTRSTRPADEEDVAGGGQLIIVRFMRDVCTISMDASGTLLHQRGYRQALAKAPLRETLAAAMLLASGWAGDRPLWDPMCGSGTVPIEAALLARRIAPGLAAASQVERAYAFHDWPDFDVGVWRDVVERARSAILPVAAVPIIGSDRDAGAVAASVANAVRAGVEADVRFVRAPLTAVTPPTGPGQLLTNPPYGVRVGERRSLYALYAALGRVASDRLAGWRVGLLVADDGLARATGLDFEELLATRNGGIAVRLLAAHLGGGAG